MMSIILSSLQSMPTGMTVDTIEQSRETAVDSTNVFNAHQLEKISEVAQGTYQQLAETSSDSLAMYIAIGAVVLAVVVYLYLKKMIQDSFKIEDNKMAEMEKKIKILNKYVKDLETGLEELKKNRLLPPPSANNNQRNQQIEPQKPAVKPTIAESRPAEKPVNRTISMYGDFYLDGDVPMVDNRDLSNNQADGMFVIMLQESATRARYTVNMAKQKAILEDVLSFTNFVNIKDIPASYSSIKVESEGELVKVGASWKIVKKMDVKLI